MEAKRKTFCQGDESQKVLNIIFKPQCQGVVPGSGTREWGRGAGWGLVKQCSCS